MVRGMETSSPASNMEGPMEAAGVPLGVRLSGRASPVSVKQSALLGEGPKKSDGDPDIKVKVWLATNL